MSPGDQGRSGAPPPPIQPSRFRRRRAESAGQQRVAPPPPSVLRIRCLEAQTRPRRPPPHHEEDGARGQLFELGPRSDRPLIAG
jgi:hypothetical protein